MHFQQQMGLRCVIPGIVFKCDTEVIGAYFLPFWQKFLFTNDKVLLLLCAHVTEKLGGY